MSLTCEDNDVRFAMNLEQRDDKQKMIDWLQTPVDRIRELVEQFACQVLELEKETLQ